ncbi:MAG TPA: YcaO-like family protein [Gaiellaceae bacterium]|nr:YcaO-like family protein [Gaiellaceae bacterium]
MIESLPRPLRRAVSPYTGIVRSLEECLHFPCEPPLFRFACEVGRGDSVLGGQLDHLSGIGGAGLTRTDAASAAIGEALERYSGTFVPRGQLVVASARELGDEAVDPARFALFADDQYATPGFPFARFTAETRVPWIRAVAVASGRPAWLPAELVFLGDPVSEGAARIGYATSSGMACGETTERALLGGLCELLERDAFMITWANSLSLPLLDWRDHPELLDLERRFFAPSGLAYAAVDLSAFHRLPSVLGVVRAPDGYPGALGVGAGTAPTVARAVWKALSEAFASRSAGAKLALLESAGGYGSAGSGVVSFEDHIAYYSDATRATAAAFLDASRERTLAIEVPSLPGETPAEHVVALCERIDAAGSGAYAVDVTAPDVRELGLTVMKVVAPELCSLDVPHEARFLGGHRLYDVAAELGLRTGRLSEPNAEPHPFP